MASSSPSRNSAPTASARSLKAQSTIARSNAPGIAPASTCAAAKSPTARRRKTCARLKCRNAVGKSGFACPLLWSDKFTESRHFRRSIRSRILFQEPPMGRQDATSANLKAVQNAPEPIDRLNLLGRWIGAKLQEMAAAEQRLDKRIETLTTTENSLKNLF